MGQPVKHKGQLSVGDEVSVTLWGNITFTVISLKGDTGTLIILDVGPDKNPIIYKKGLGWYIQTSY